MIYIEDQMVKLNGVTLPGLVKSIEVVNTAKIDEQEVEGSATKPKQATGYEDDLINVVRCRCLTDNGNRLRHGLPWLPAE